MSKAVQHRRGNSLDHASFIGLPGELTVNTDTRDLHVHDGSTLGGFPLRQFKSLSAFTSLAHAEAAAQISPFAVVIDRPFSVSSSLTISALQLFFTGQGRLDPAAGVTIRIETPILAGCGQIFGGSGYVVPALRVDRVMPQWWGAKGDGVSDDSSAIQKAINSIQLAGMGILFFPSGTYRMGSLVTATDCDIQVVGAGNEVVKIVSANANGCFLVDYTKTREPAPNQIEYRCYFGHMTFIPGATRAAPWGGSGYPIRVNRAVRGLAHQAQSQTFESLSVRTSEAVPWGDPAAPQFDGALYLKNASQTIISDCFFDGPGCHGSDAIRVDNTLDVNDSQGAYYALRIVGTDVAGWRRGVYQTGWLESVYIDNSSFTSSLWSCLRFDATGTTLYGVAGNYCGHFTMSNCHLNAQSRGLDLLNWRHVQVFGNNFYVAHASHASGKSIQDLAAVNIEPLGGESFIITGNFFNNAVFDNSDISLSSAVRFERGPGSKFVVADNVFKWSGGGVPSKSAAANHVVHMFGEFDNVSIRGNVIVQTDNPCLQYFNAIFFQGAGGATPSVSVSGNTVENFEQPIVFNDANLVVFGANMVKPGASGVSRVDFIGTAKGSLVSSGDGTQYWSGVAGSTIDSTVNPWGLFEIGNAVAVSMSTISAGYDGQRLSIKFSDGKTTVAHNSGNILLSGSANWTPPADSFLYLIWQGGRWWEVSRRVG